jgi:hypothetical protein
VDYDNALGFKLTLHERYEVDRDWFKVDIHSLTIETRICTDSSCSSTLLTSLDEKPKQTSNGQATWYKSLDWKIGQDDEFSFDFSNCKVVIGSPGFPISTLANKAWVLFPQHIKSSSFRRFRALAREARRHQALVKQIERRREQEREELKRKQLLEIQQKQKDLVQLALKRAQNAQLTKKTSSPAPVNKPSMWSSSGTSSAPPIASAWSSATARPLVPPPMPVAWTVLPPPIAPMMHPAAPLSLQATLMQDPWSTPNVWADQPQAKRARPPPEPDNKNP